MVGTGRTKEQTLTGRLDGWTDRMPPPLLLLIRRGEVCVSLAREGLLPPRSLASSAYHSILFPATTSCYIAFLVLFLGGRAG